MQRFAPSASSVSRRALGAFCLSTLALTAHAANFFWDADGEASAGYGGDGIWNTTTANWNTAGDGTGSLQTWTNSPLDEAHFLRATTGAINVSGTITAKSLVFLNSGSGLTEYTLTGGALDLRQVSFSHAINSTGNNTLNSAVHLFGGLAASTSHRARLNNASGTLTLGAIQDISGVTGTHTLVLESYGTALNINGDITKSTDSAGIVLEIGTSGTSNSTTYTLGGNNTGLTGGAKLYRGTLRLTNSNALAGISGLNVENAGTGSADTAIVLVGSGVSINKSITFVANTGDTAATDVRRIGGDFTSGSAAYTSTVNVNVQKQASGVEFTAAAGGRVNFTGSIAGSGLITKVGDGVVAFTRPSNGTSHTGGVVVAAGTLLANGINSTGSSAVTVNSGATLGGNGTVNGTVTLAAGGRLSPGDMAADNVASLAGTFNGGSSLTWNSDDSTAGMVFHLGIDQASSDQIVVTGAFTKGSGSNFIFDFTGSTINPSITYTLITFGSTDFSLGDFSAINGAGGVFGFAGNSLTFSAIPEPASFAALMGMGALALFGASRRRCRA